MLPGETLVDFCFVSARPLASCDRSREMSWVVVAAGDTPSIGGGDGGCVVVGVLVFALAATQTWLVVLPTSTIFDFQFLQAGRAGYPLVQLARLT